MSSLEISKVLVLIAKMHSINRKSVMTIMVCVFFFLICLFIHSNELICRCKMPTNDTALTAEIALASNLFRTNWTKPDVTVKNLSHKDENHISGTVPQEKKQNKRNKCKTKEREPSKLKAYFRILRLMRMHKTGTYVNRCSQILGRNFATICYSIAVISISNLLILFFGHYLWCDCFAHTHARAFLCLC